MPANHSEIEKKLWSSADELRAINDAMHAIEAENDELKGVLPKTYPRLNNDTLVALLKTFSLIPIDIEGDVFGKIYEYFLGKFAMFEGQKGGEFFTPTVIIKLIVEIIEPFSGRIFDPPLPKLILGEIDLERLEIAGAEETGEVETKAIEV